MEWMNGQGHMERYENAIKQKKHIWNVKLAEKRLKKKNSECLYEPKRRRLPLNLLPAAARMR